MPSSLSHGPRLQVLPGDSPQWRPALRIEMPNAHSASPQRTPLISTAREEALFIGFPKPCSARISRTLRGLAVLVGYELSQSVDMRLEADAPGTPPRNPLASEQGTP